MITKLITSLRTAVENGEGMLDKDATSDDDVFDAFRMSLQFCKPDSGDMKNVEYTEHT
jgi:hypothetical protein